MVAKKSPNSYSHLWLFHATILDAGTHFRLSAAFDLNLGCHFADFSLFLWPNNRPHLSLIGFWKNSLAIITPIGQSMLSLNSWSQIFNLRTIGGCTYRNHRSGRPTILIPGQI